MLGSGRNFLWVIGAFLALAWMGAIARADQLILNDGTSLFGTVISQGDKYWIKTEDGETQTIPKDQVKSLIKAGSKGAGGSAPAPKLTTLTAAQHWADTADTAEAALDIWRAFLESNPSPADRDIAKAEFDKWKKRVDSHAVKNNGKWVTDEDRKVLVEKINDMLAQAQQLVKDHKTLQAIQKLEEAHALYPTYYSVNFQLGTCALMERDFDKATLYYEQCIQRRPNAPETLNNIALVYFEKKLYEKSLATLYKAVSARDSLEIVHNLILALEKSPKAVVNSGSCKEALEAGNLLSSKYAAGLATITKKTEWIVIVNSDAAGGEGHAPAGSVSVGTGMVINAEGVILTNCHVIADARKITVQTDGGLQLAAEVVASDPKQDMALIRIKKEKDANLPPLSFSKVDRPAVGAQCFAMGYPLANTIGAGVKITQGIVSGSSHVAPSVDIMIDAKVNPGNSGGPLLDKYCHIIGMVSAKSFTSSTEDSYGLAIGVWHLRDFAHQNNIQIQEAEGAGDVLNAEDVVAKARGSIVCITASH